MHKQPSDTDQSRAHPAAALEEMLKGPSRNKSSCSAMQIKTKPVLIIDGSQGMVGKGKDTTWDPRCIFSKASKAFSGTGWRGKLQSLMFKNRLQCISNINFTRDRISF